MDAIPCKRESIVIVSLLCSKNRLTWDLVGFALYKLVDFMERCKVFEGWRNGSLYVFNLCSNTKVISTDQVHCTLCIGWSLVYILNSTCARIMLWGRQFSSSIYCASHWAGLRSVNFPVAFGSVWPGVGLWSIFTAWWGEASGSQYHMQLTGQQILLR